MLFELEQFIRAAMVANMKPGFFCALAVSLLNLPVTAAVTLSQIENFSGSHGWTSGLSNPNPPVMDANGGPMGEGDAALRVTSNGGTNAGGRLIAFNVSHWTGDFLTAGVVSISADLRNLGSNPLSMRLAFNGPGGWWVTAPAQLMPFSGWSSRVFDIRPGSLLVAEGDDAAATLAAVTEMRILHSSAVTFRGAAVSGSFLVDNLRAIPEPAGGMMSGLAGLLLLRRSRKF